MVIQNCALARLAPSYLFQEIQKKKRAFLQKHPNATLIDLGIGDTTQPIPASAGEAMAEAALAMTKADGYCGYGPEGGLFPLREAISQSIYQGVVDPEAIFISDGAKCDIGRFQVLFGSSVSIAVQNPAYPVFADGSQIIGVLPEKVHFLPCTPENDFFPSVFPEVDLFYICSPNNPTGQVLKKERLMHLVSHARKTQAIIIFDAAYASFIADPALPKSIYEIPGAEEVAIEIGSFSKMAGFTGLRLGWSVVPAALRFRGGKSVQADWHRVIGTLFNGASRIIQEGARRMLANSGQKEMDELISYYRANAQVLKRGFIASGLEVYGGENAPYLWVRFLGKSSWEIFHELLEKVHCLTIPGVGFGSLGEGFIRVSALGSREAVLEATKRFSSVEELLLSSRN